MKPTVLLYNVTDRTRLLKIHQALLPLGFRIRRIEPTEFTLPLGVLAGIDREPALEQPDTAEADGTSRVYEKQAAFTDEMAVMAGFSSAQVDAFILALRKNGIGRIDYKAVLTPTNRGWDSIRLYQEIKKEHEQMHAEETGR